jgi:D-alanyl-lipoteichoic acid acyltransferase DltB (MBOAT superfamily)
MQFVSFAFILVLLVVAGVNHVVPRKYRYIWLLLVSMAFYVSLDAKYTMVLILSILSTYGAGLAIGKATEDNRSTTLIFVLCLVLNISLILGFKVAGLFTAGSILAPIGISFYALKAISYLIDVKRGTIKAEKNLIAYALYV